MFHILAVIAACPTIPGSILSGCSAYGNGRGTGLPGSTIRQFFCLFILKLDSFY